MELITWEGNTPIHQHAVIETIRRQHDGFILFCAEEHRGNATWNIVLTTEEVQNFIDGCIRGDIT